MGSLPCHPSRIRSVTERLGSPWEGARSSGHYLSKRSVGSTIAAVKRSQRRGPLCGCAVTTEWTIQRGEPEWRQEFLSSMMCSIVGIYSARSSAPHHVQPIWAADGIQALSEARKHRSYFILLDLGLPGGGLCPRTTAAEPAAVGHSSSCGDGADPGWRTKNPG
jgi:hypothetical protein